MPSIAPYSPKVLNQQPHCGTRCQATFAANRDSAADAPNDPKSGATVKDWIVGSGVAAIAFFFLRKNPQVLDDVGKTVIKLIKDGKALFRKNLPEIKRQVDKGAKYIDETLFKGEGKAEELVKSVRKKIRELGLDDLQTNTVEQWLHNFFKDAEKAAQGKTDLLDNFLTQAKSFWDDLLK